MTLLLNGQLKYLNRDQWNRHVLNSVCVVPVTIILLDICILILHTVLVHLRVKWDLIWGGGTKMVNWSQVQSVYFFCKSENKKAYLSKVGIRKAKFYIYG